MKTKIIKAISDGTRLGLLGIIRKKEICACELPHFVKVTQPAVSQHLKVLLKAGLVKVRKKGTKRLYSLSPLGRRVIKDISGW
ncbi:MAG: metalloregulator ArsR/SmtB family transcription factor [Candidatus Anstonellales archaeon]